MKSLLLIILLFSVALQGRAQEKTDPWLEKLVRKQASPFLQQVLDQPDTFQYQLIYTQIDRDKNNQPHFTNYYFHVDRNRYFNPASMVKLPTALLALEKIHSLEKYGAIRSTTMITDSGYARQTRVTHDSSAANYLPSVEHYVKKVFLVSDNDAYNRLYEFVGQQTLNQRTADLCERLNGWLQDQGAGLRARYFGSRFGFVALGGASAGGTGALFRLHLLERGVYLHGDCGSLSLAHGPAEIERIESAVRDTVLALRTGGFLG